MSPHLHTITMRITLIEPFNSFLIDELKITDDLDHLRAN